MRLDCSRWFFPGARITRKTGPELTHRVATEGYVYEVKDEENYSARRNDERHVYMQESVEDRIKGKWYQTLVPLSHVGMLVRSESRPSPRGSRCAPKVESH